MPKKLKKVAVLVETSRVSGRTLIEGISEFAATQNDWQLCYHEGTLDTKLSEWIHHWDGDGLITRLTHWSDAEAVSTRALPTVDLFGAHNLRQIPSVTCDHASVAHMAVDFFLASGFTNLAFCGYPGVHFSDMRQKVFEETAQSTRITVSSYTSSIKSKSIHTREAWSPERENNLISWIHSLPKPVAIFTCNDVRALDVAAACRMNHVRVPEEVTILGVDNDPLICNMGNPAISSIELNNHRHGYRAAECLNRLFNGESLDAHQEKIPAKALIERPSTDMMVFEKAHVSEALRYMRSHLDQSMGSEQIAKHVGVSRSLLDRDLKLALGRTVSQELARSRLVRISHLLIHTSMTLQEISENTGFSDNSNLAKFFKSATGQTPSQYKSSHHTS